MPCIQALSHFFALVDIKAMDKYILKKDLETLKRAFDGSACFKGRVDSTGSVEYRFCEVEKLAGGQIND